MKITVIGTGYVGLVTGACLAEMGNQVVCLDLDAQRIAALNRGEMPIHEPGLGDVVARNAQAGRLRFTADIDTAVAHGLLQFIAVGTPPSEDGSADLQHVLAAARAVAERMQGYKLIINKSTVPVGTADTVANEVTQVLAARGLPPVQRPHAGGERGGRAVRNGGGAGLLRRGRHVAVDGRARGHRGRRRVPPAPLRRRRRRP